MEFHHFGLAVNQFEPALTFFRNLGYTATAPVTDHHQKVELIMCHHDSQPDVELIKPLHEGSPVSAFLKKNNEMIYHPCYRVASIQKTIEEDLKGMRVIKISGASPAVLFDNNPVAFFYVKGVGLIELLELNDE
jgi:hypothetical protein